MKKRICAALLAAALCLGLVGCSGSTDLFRGITSIFSKSEVETPDASETEHETPADEGQAQTSNEAQQEDEDDKITPVTELSEGLDAFGLAYQLSYGLHPYNCISLNNRVILSFIYEPLFAVDNTFEAVPVLAESYFVSNDGLQTTVTIRADAKFSNGEAVTAADAAYSINSAKDSDYYGNRLNCITAAEATDARTLVLTTRTAYGSLPLLLDIPIIPVDTAEENTPIGSGPYIYSNNTTLTRNADWWQDGEPLVDFEHIRLTHVLSAADIRDNFEYENVNIVLSDPNSSAYVNFHNDYELWTQSTTVMQYIGYNLGSNVFSNYGLRGAITYAIDRESIVTEETNGFALAATLPCSPLSDNYDVKLANTYGYNLTKFYDRLESASVEDMDADGVLDLYVTSLGYAVSCSGTMIVCSSSYQRVQTATRIANTLNELGFKITVKSLDADEYASALRNGNFDLYYGEIRLSPNFDLSPFFRSGGSVSYGYLADSTMENLCNRTLLNSGNSYDLYKRLCDRGYITPILFKNHAVFTTRGAVQNPVACLDWFFPEQPAAE